MLPDITIVTTTWFPDDERGKARLTTAEMAVCSWAENLRYDGRIFLHIADDGSHDLDSFEVLGEIWNKDWLLTQQDRCGVGASLNAGFTRAFERSLLAFYIVDDWELKQPLDISPWVQLLLTNESIGVVRLGIAHPDLTGVVRHCPETGEYYLLLDRHHYAFAHRPALYHKRFIDAYGPFEENVNAFECEREYNERFAAQAVYTAEKGAVEIGPDIALALLHSWRHISDIELADVEPSLEKCEHDLSCS